MTITNIMYQHGQVMMRRDDLAKYLGISAPTVDARCKEMEEEIRNGRYSERVITKIGGIKLINYLAFCDFLHYKDRLQHKNLRKTVPPYDPAAWARDLGIYSELQKVEA